MIVLFGVLGLLLVWVAIIVPKIQPKTLSNIPILLLMLQVSQTPRLYLQLLLQMSHGKINYKINSKTTKTFYYQQLLVCKESSHKTFSTFFFLIFRVFCITLIGQSKWIGLSWICLSKLFHDFLSVHFHFIFVVLPNKFHLDLIDSLWKCTRTSHQKKGTRPNAVF